MLELTRVEMKTKTVSGRGKWRQMTVCLFLTATLLISAPLLTFSATDDEVKQEIKDKEAELARLNDEIKKQQQAINEAQKTANTLKNQIVLFNAQIKQNESQVLATQTKIDLANSKIAELSNSIAESEGRMEDIKVQLSALIRELYQMDRSNATIVTLMNNESFSEFFNDLMKIENIQGKSYDLLQEIKVLKEQLEEEKKAVEAERVELQEFRNELADRQRVLSQQRSAKDDLLALTKGQEQEYKKLLASAEAQEEQIEKEIEELEAKLRKDIGPLASPGEKGLFYWPLDGWLTQRYGRTGFTSLGYSFHNGLDIAAPAGTPIYAAYDGEVLHRGSGQAAYGNWVTVKHDLPNGRTVVTLYAHLMTINVIRGQKVQGGTTMIGKEGNTGNTTRLLYGPHRGFHLHFTVFDYQGYRVVPGAYTSKYGPYEIPTGLTYDPMDFL